MPLCLIVTFALLPILSVPSAGQSGGHIVFLDRGGISMMSADGSRSTTVLEADWAHDPAWSPLGDQIAVSCSVPGTSGSDICLVATDGSGWLNLTGDSEGRFASPTWAPDGQRIALLSFPPIGSDGDTHLLSWPVSGGEPDTLATATTHFANASWSPDGRWIAVESNGIRLVSTLGLDPIQLTDALGRDQSPSWSPDAGQIAFASNRLGGCHTLLVVDVGDGSVSRLLPDGSCGIQPAWSPNGQSIAYVAPTATELEIRLIQPDGTVVRSLARGTNPDWAPTSFRTAVRSASWANLKVRYR